MFCSAYSIHINRVIGKAVRHAKGTRNNEGIAECSCNNPTL